MKFWEGLTLWQQRLTAAAGLLVMASALLVWLPTPFHTDAEAAQLWQQHEQAITCRTVAELRVEVRALTERLRFDPGLTAEQREWLRQEIANIQAEIQRLDPNGRC